MRLFKQRSSARPPTPRPGMSDEQRKRWEQFQQERETWKKKYGEITLLDFHIWIIIREVASPYGEASPDFCNWEHEHMLYHGLEVRAPLASSMVHAKRWTRFPEVDIARCVRIMTNAGYRGYFAAEYEEQGDGVEGSKKIMEEVLAAL